MAKFFLSNILFAAGLGIVFFLGMFYYQQIVSTWLLDSQQAIEWPAAGMPHVALPPTTPTPFPTPSPLPPTPTPIPTPTPEPQIPVRLVIPDIGVNQVIVETGLEVVGWNGMWVPRWQAPDFAVGHRETSARPGQRGNMILSGHNNTAGSVFRDLEELEPGAEIIVYTADEAYTYRVESSETVLWVGADEAQMARHYELGGDTPDETLTLISCWPYVTYSHRIYVRAKPVLNDNQ